MKWTKFAYLPDPHGELLCEKAWAVVKQFLADYQPDRIIIGGDVFQFAGLRKGADPDEARHQIRPDFDAGIRILEESGATDVLMGNHDDRLFRAAKSTEGPLGEFYRDMQDRLELWANGRGIKLKPYHAKSYIQIGPQLKAVHGNCANMHSAKKMADAYGCVLYGHVHGVQYSRSHTLDRREAWACGCLCDIWQDYNKDRHATFAHNHGFAFGEYSDTSFDVQIAQKRNEIWRIGGKTYG